MHARALDHGVDHRVGGVASLPKVRAQADYGDISGVGVPNFPSCAVVHLGAIQQRYNVRGFVDGVTAPLKDMLLGFRTEGGEVIVVKEVAGPSHGGARNLTQPVAEGGKICAFRVGEQRPGEVDVVLHGLLDSGWVGKRKAPPGRG